jgi:membrane-associated phospholipid phosphatase
MSTFWDGFTAFLITVLLILGGYQIYFLPQKYPARKSVQLQTPLDKAIPFMPIWVWVYSFFYYPFIISTLLTLTDFRQFAFTALSYILLLLFQILIAYVYPVRTPPHWRDYDPKNSLSEKFLSIVHNYDQGGNCFPSMHVGVSMLTTLHISNNITYENGKFTIGVYLVNALICASTLFTKQHYIADIPAGIALALVVFKLFQLIY